MTILGDTGIPFFSNSSGGGAVTQGTTQTITGIKTWLAPAIGATAEIVAKFGTTDDGVDRFNIYNTNTADNAFNTGLSGVSQFSAQPALTLTGDVFTSDNGTQPAILFTAVNASTPVVTRPVFGWNNYTTRLATMYSNGLYDNGGTLRATGFTPPATGVGAELSFSAGVASLNGYNRGTSAFIPVQVVGSTAALVPNGTPTFTASPTANSGTVLFDNAASIRATGSTGPASGAGVELDYGRAGAGVGSVLCFNRASPSYLPFQVECLTFKVVVGSVNAFTSTSTTNTHAVPEILASYTVATLPAASIGAGAQVYASNAAVAPCVAFSNGTLWKRCDNAATTVV